MVVVQMLGTTLVYPSSPFPSCHQPLPLSHLDTDRILHLPFRTLRLYAPSLSPADVVANALSAALPLFFPLAASLFRRPSDNRHEVRPHATGIPFTRAASPLTLAELSARPGSPLLDRFAPDPAPGEALAHPLAIQVTRLACGGFALGACVHHSLCDGAGFTQFLSAVAGFARGAERPVVEPVWERTELLGPRSPARVEVPLFRHVLGFDGDVARSGPYDVVEASIEGPLVRECFHVSEACMERLRNRLAEEAGSSFTTFEALSAYIWRARIKASGTPQDEVVKLVYSMNIRRLLKPALPAGYWGNVCVPVYVHLSVRELMEQPLWETARSIKTSKQNVTDEYVRSYIDFQQLHYAEGITAGKRVSAFTDWRHLGHSDIDFGWGGPVSVMPLSWRLLGSLEPCFLLPNGAADEVEKKNGFKVLISLPVKVMQSFRAAMENICELIP
ncbi:hypothetical protein OPV22_025787 [Ensete ventricosum]|uniref:3'-N-debenzoyl-2'-deoxytaxol N-benzoyltransferase n=1 Tax=Ensete ventricosum TaxID=4639 RepID=A0AAV8QE13_ENSVE|nr:hypothetical protein OPV22_025787 [Ensete ventricosum]